MSENASSGAFNSEFVKWWCGTVIVGAIPIFIRLIISSLSHKDIEIINATELICFGFSIQISTIYFSVGQINDSLRNKIMINATFSIIFVVILSVLYSVTMLLAEDYNLILAKIIISIICLISLYTGHNSVRCAILAQKMR